jgi:hypothetical protein
MRHLGRSYTLFTSERASVGLCTSAFTGTQIAYTLPILTSSVFKLGSSTFSGLITFSSVSSITSGEILIVTAPAISGWNFPQAANVGAGNGSGTITSSGGSADDSAGSIPNGAIAGIAVAATFAALGIGAALCLLYLLMRTRRRLAEALALANAKSPGGGRPRDTIGTSTTRYISRPGAAYSPLPQESLFRQSQEPSYKLYSHSAPLGSKHLEAPIGHAKTDFLQNQANAELSNTAEHAHPAAELPSGPDPPTAHKD